MAANLQIFMTNTASHCKGMWNLCVISALKKKQFISCRRRANICPFQQKITWQRRSPWSQYVFQDLQRKREECLGKVIRFFTVSTSRSRLEHLCVLTDHQKKKTLRLFHLLKWKSCLAFEMFVFLWKVKASTPLAHILVWGCGSVINLFFREKHFPTFSLCRLLPSRWCSAPGR